MDLKKKLFMLILVLIYTQMLFSSDDKDTVDIKRKRSKLEYSLSRRLVIIIDENFGYRQLTDLLKTPLMGFTIYSFLNAKERANLRLLSQFFHERFDDFYFNPRKELYQSLNKSGIELNDKFIDNAFMKYKLEKKEKPNFLHSWFLFPSKCFFKGYKLTEMYWVSNLDLPTYATKNFILDMIGNGSVEISDSDLFDKRRRKQSSEYKFAQKTNKSHYDGVSWNKHDEKWMSHVSKRPNSKLLRYCGQFSDEVQAAMRVNELSERYGQPMPNNLTMKTLNIVKDSNGIKVSFFAPIGGSKSKFFDSTILNPVIVKFCPQDDKVIVSIENEEFAVLENPKFLRLTMNPHEYNFNFKFS